MQNFLLPLDLGQAIINYLAQRPYAEVATMILRLQQLAHTPESVEPQPGDGDPGA